MNKLFAALLLAVCVLSVSADVAIEHRKRTSPLVWMVPVGIAIAVGVGAAARKKRRAQQ
ncbi:MAG TPA: hypothetical protein VNI54_16890 [Thermoanaerobaculia bacterium]|nr:hypothetical protein [Thermoanaerobaculia bacterium]